MRLALLWTIIERVQVLCHYDCSRRRITVFTRYLLGKERFTLWTAHKHLITLINTRDIDQTPIRFQRLFHFSEWCGSTQWRNIYPERNRSIIADTLSRQPQECPETPDTVEEVQAYMFPKSRQIREPITIRTIRDATDADKTLQKVIDYTVSGWPRHAKDIDGDTSELFNAHEGRTNRHHS